MHPVLFEAPWGNINGYGSAIVFGIALTVPLARWDARRRGLDWKFVLDFYLVLIVGGFIGGRAAFVLTNLDQFQIDPHAIFALRDGGFVFYGSLLGAIAGLVLVAHRHRVSIGVVLDLLLTWMPLAHVFGRIGCFLAGCCWGAAVPDDWHGWAVQFPEGAAAWYAVPHGVGADGRTLALHPVQLYEAISLVFVFAILASMRIRRGIEGPWLQSGRYLIAYGILRTLTELFRGDAARGHLLELSSPAVSSALGLPAEHPLLLSTSQALCIVVTGLGLGLLTFARHRTEPAKRESSLPPSAAAS